MLHLGPYELFVSASLLIGTCLSAPEKSTEILNRDVCIIGGGSAGTYTAVRLKQMGKSVILIEKEDLLGGQVNTYTDPASGKTIDYGVKVFNNISVVTDYFASLDVQLAPFTGYVPDETTIYADLATASDIPASTIPPAGNLTEGLLRYQAQLNKYPYLENGFDLQYPVPEELLMPWGGFIEKHNLSSISGLVYGLVGGPGNILSQPAIYVMKNFNEVQVHSALTYSSLTTTSLDNQELYNKALAFLGNGSDAFLSSGVTAVTRRAGDVEVDVDTPFGPKKIEASQLVIAVPPTLSTLEPFLDLSRSERDIFGHFNNSYLFASIVGNSGIGKTASLANVDLEAPLGIPPEPSIFLTEPTEVDDYHVVLYGSPHYVSDEAVQANIVSTLNRWKRASNRSTGTLEQSAEIIAFKSHSPYFLTVSVEAIRNGFYEQANMLQGQYNTFHTGAAWETNDSSLIWRFTEEQILPRIMAVLKRADRRSLQKRV